MVTDASTLLLTGATGQLGAALLPRLLEEPGLRVIALVRARDAAHLAARRDAIHADLPAGVDRGRLEVVQGDVSRPELGLAGEDRMRLLQHVTAILHAAASVRFDMPAEKAAHENMASTGHVVELARALHAAGRLERLDHVSTAYVAGDRRGRVLETECDEGQGFRNSYEWSKCQSEKSVRALQADGLPAAIHRPSIVVGDSRTGETRAFNVMYWPLKLYARGIFGFFPGRADTLVDAVPVDWVAATIAELRRRDEAIGQCFHVAAGDDALSVGELAGHIARLVGRPPLRFVDQGRYRRFVRPLLRAVFSLHPKGRAILRGGAAYMPYFLGNPLFDTSNLRRVLGDASTAPPILEYLDRVIGYAMERDFGREPAGSGGVDR